MSFYVNALTTTFLNKSKNLSYKLKIECCRTGSAINHTIYFDIGDLIGTLFVLKILE